MKFLFFLFLASNIVYSQMKDSLKVTYLANEGFLISYQGKNILIDVLFNEGFGRFAVPSDSLRSKIINGESPFNKIDLYLVTHKDPDHFYAPYIINFLNNHKETSFIASKQVTDQLSSVPAIKNQIHSVTVALGSSEDTVINDIQLKTIRVRHNTDQSGNSSVNLSYLININGVKILHVGDCNFEFDSLAFNKFHLGNENIDLMFKGCFDISKTAQRVIKEDINPQYLAAMHMPPKSFPADSVNFINTYPNGIVLKNEMDTKSIIPKVQYQYLGLTPPGDTPVIFAPGIISSDKLEHSAPTFSSDGKEIYWSVIRNQNDTIYQDIMYMQWNGKEWTNPQLAPFSGKYYDGGPVFSPDGNRLYIYRDLPVPPGKDANNINVICFTKIDNKWVNPINMNGSFSHSLTNQGTIYYGGRSGIFRMKYSDGKYLPPEYLNNLINLSSFQNWTPFIAPDESYLIFSRLNENGDYGNLFITFHDNQADTWTEPKDMGKEINTGSQERFPSVSPDGKYLFFTRWTKDNNHDVFWVSTKVIDEIKETIHK